MERKFLDSVGLTYFWQKVKSFLANKAEKDHTHTNYITPKELQTALNSLDFGFCNDETDMNS